MLFLNTREQNNMGHFKEFDIVYISIFDILKLSDNVEFLYNSENGFSIFETWGTEHPFRANFCFGYTQSGHERTSFSGSTVLWKH